MWSTAVGSPALDLVTTTGERQLTDIASELLARNDTPGDHAGRCQRTTISTPQAWRFSQARWRIPALTPSARILQQMHDEEIPFFRLAMNQSEQLGQGVPRANR